MYCPSCENRLEPGVDRCDLCGFHLGKLDAIYGSDTVVMDQLTDTTYRLRSADKEALWEEIDAFEQQFPQFYPAFYVADLQRDTRLSEFAAWMLNRARIDVSGELRTGASAFLVVVDLLNRQATISPGYAAEAFVAEKDLLRILDEAKPALSSAQIAEALRVIVQGLRRSLKRNYRTLSKTPIPPRHSQVQWPEEGIDPPEA